MARLNYILLPEHPPDGPIYRKGWRPVKPNAKAPTGIGAAAILAAKRRMRGDARPRVPAVSQGPVVHMDVGPPPRRAEMALVLDADVVMFEDDYIDYPPIIAGCVPVFHGDNMEIDSEGSSGPSNPSHGNLHDVTASSHNGIPLHDTPPHARYNPRERPQIDSDNVARTYHNNDLLDTEVVPDLAATNVGLGRTPHNPIFNRSYTSTGPRAVDDIFGGNVNAAAGSTTPWLSSVFPEACHNSPVRVGQDDPFLARIYYTRPPAIIVHESPSNTPQIVDDVFGGNPNPTAGSTTPWLSSVFPEACHNSPVRVGQDDSFLTQTYYTQSPANVFNESPSGPQLVDDIFGGNANAVAGSTTPWLSSVFREACHNSPVHIGQDDSFLAQTYYTRSPATVFDESPSNSGPQIVEDIFGIHANVPAIDAPWLSSVFPLPSDDDFHHIGQDDSFLTRTYFSQPPAPVVDHPLFSAGPLAIEDFFPKVLTSDNAPWLSSVFPLPSDSNFLQVSQDHAQLFNEPINNKDEEEEDEGDEPVITSDSPWGSLSGNRIGELGDDDEEDEADDTAEATTNAHKVTTQDIYTLSSFIGFAFISFSGFFLSFS